MDTMPPNFSSTKLWNSLETCPVEHFARMALNQGSIDHARFRLRELEQDETGMWIGLGQAVAKRLKELRDEANRGD
jgi:hypothetical protein